MKPTLLYRALLTLAIGALPGVGHPQAATPENAWAWLERMAQATSNLHYEGTFVYLCGAQVETLRIVREGGPDDERQRLVSLSGPAREVVVEEHQDASWIVPNRQTAWAEDPYRYFPLLAVIPRERGRLESHYELQLLEEDRVAGRAARVIAIKPRDTWRFGYRLWLDQQTGMALRTVLLDEKGRPIEQILFTELQIKPHLPGKLPGLSKSSVFSLLNAPVEGIGTDQKEKVNIGPSVARETVVQSAWRVGAIPAGFTKVSQQRFAEALGQHPTEHWVFADGLATISVFLEKLEGDPPLLQGSSQWGSMNAFGLVLEGHQVLVVGEVPTATVQHIAMSIRHSSETSLP